MEIVTTKKKRNRDSEYTLHNCSFCGKEHRMEKYALKKRGKGFCSIKCYGLSRRNKIFEFKCDTCGKLFLVKEWLVKQRNIRFCSRKCSALSQKKDRIKICTICGKKYRATGDRFDTAKYCSFKCRGVSQSINRRGENSATWKGGLTEERIWVRSCKKYKEWRDSIFKRDSWTCQKCGSNKGDKHAHHLNRFTNIIQDIHKKFPLFNLKDIAESYSPLWDISNGITLCKKCHRDTHREEGI